MLAAQEITTLTALFHPVNAYPRMGKLGGLIEYEDSIPTP
jgi:hypothetical protein